jgi:hypothetical protein
MERERCDWCGTAVEHDDGWRAFEPEGARRAVFCRLEHVVPWAIKGPHWRAGDLDEPDGVEWPDRCSHCGEALPDTRVLAARHRGEYRVPDAFCSVEHLRLWAQSGGRWA